MTEINQVLLLMAHPALDRSEINRPMFHQAVNTSGVTSVDLYRQYPRFNIDVNAEQQRLLQHQVILFQFPFYWYSVPALLKEWMDLVLEYGFAYGQDGTALKGKRFAVALTAGGREDSYHADGLNRCSLTELLRPLEQMAQLTGMIWQPPFVIYGARTAAEDGRLTPHLDQWQQWLAHWVKENQQ